MFARGRVCGRVGEAQARQVPADLHNLPVLPVVVEFEKGSEVSPTSELGEWPHLFGSRVRHRFATEFANQFGVGLVTLRVGVSLARPMYDNIGFLVFFLPHRLRLAPRFGFAILRLLPAVGGGAPALFTPAWRNATTMREPLCRRGNPTIITTTITIIRKQATAIITPIRMPVPVETRIRGTSQTTLPANKSLSLLQRRRYVLRTLCSQLDSTCLLPYSRRRED